MGRCRLGAAPALSLLLALIAGPVQAELTLVPTLSSSLSYDSNVFRFADDFELEPDSQQTRADGIFTNTLGLESSYRWSNQQLFANLQGSRFSHLNNTQLDQTGYQLDGGLNWSLFSRVTGTLTAGTGRTRSSFVNLDTDALNRQRSTTLGAAVQFKIGNDLQTDLRHDRTRLQLPAIENLGFTLDQHTSSVALQYIGINRVAIGVIGSVSAGDFGGDQSQGRFDQFAASGTLQIDASEISKLTLSAGYTERRDQALDVKTSGLTGNLNYFRALTGKTTANLNLTRAVEASPFGDNAVVATSAQILLGYDATAKINATLTYNWQQIAFRTLGDAASIFDGRTDQQHTVSVAAAYTPLRWLTLSPSVQHESRTANQPGFAFTAWVAALTIGLRFE